jgi:hypothetical protein
MKDDNRKLIDLEPGEWRSDIPQAKSPSGPVFSIATLAIGISIAAMNYKGPISFGTEEVIALSVWFFLFWLLTRKRRDGRTDASPHEQARKSFAFRLGKSLNRVRRSLSRRT